jgi:Uncharacterized protein conserved in bacteria (DUF2330)
MKRSWSCRPLLLAAVVGLLAPSLADAACCYFSAKNADILQPAQKVFITWDPVKKAESFTVQPKFEGNALDFGMVIPTPSQPKLHEMPRDFFKSLAIYTILKKREFPQSKLLPLPQAAPGFAGGAGGGYGFGRLARGRAPAIKVLESGVVGSLDYKIIEAGRADDLYQWLKDNKYQYTGDEATLNFYVQKKWVFTVMKIDTMQMKKNPDGSYAGEVTPTRFQFASEKLVYPLKITQLSVKDKTEALFYVQAPTKVDLPGDLSYQYQWVPMLQAASGCTPGGLPGQGADWLKAVQPQLPALLRRGQELGFTFVSGQRPRPNGQGRMPTTMEWAKRLTAADVKVLKGEAPYSEKLPDVDEGFTQADVKDPKRAEAVFKVIRERLDKAHKERPVGYLVRTAPAEDVRQLNLLVGHLQAGLFITKFRKVFTRGEMNDDLELVPATQGQSEDRSEYEETLPTSPP